MRKGESQGVTFQMTIILMGVHSNALCSNRESMLAKD